MTKERKQAVCKNSGTLNRMKSQFKAKLNNNLKCIKLKFTTFILLKVSTIKYPALSPWIRILFIYYLCCHSRSQHSTTDNLFYCMNSKRTRCKNYINNDIGDSRKSGSKGQVTKKAVEVSTKNVKTKCLCNTTQIYQTLQACLPSSVVKP